MHTMGAIDFSRSPRKNQTLFLVSLSLSLSLSLTRTLQVAHNLENGSRQGGHSVGYEEEDRKKRDFHFSAPPKKIAPPDPRPLFPFFALLPTTPHSLFLSPSSLPSSSPPSLSLASILRPNVLVAQKQNKKTVNRITSCGGGHRHQKINLKRESLIALSWQPSFPFSLSSSIRPHKPNILAFSTPN